MAVSISGLSTPLARRSSGQPTWRDWRQRAAFGHDKAPCCPPHPLIMHVCCPFGQFWPPVHPLMLNAKQRRTPSVAKFKFFSSAGTCPTLSLDFRESFFDLDDFPFPSPFFPEPLPFESHFAPVKSSYFRLLSAENCPPINTLVLTTRRLSQREKTHWGVWPSYKPTRSSRGSIKDLPPRRPPTAGAHTSQPLTPASASSTRWRDPPWPAAAARASSP